jgi:hypothetical protein
MPAKFTLSLLFLIFLFLSPDFFVHSIKAQAGEFDSIKFGSFTPTPYITLYGGSKPINAPTVTPVSTVSATPIIVSGTIMPSLTSVVAPSAVPTPTIKSKKSKKKKKKTPPPGGGGNVEQMVDSINDACNNQDILASNVACLEKTNPKLDHNVWLELNKSAVSQGCLQCVGFARAAARLQYNVTLTSCGNAVQYASCSIPGVNFIKKGNGNIQVGDIPVWNNDTYGHIAYVVQTLGSGSFRIAEANWGLGHCGNVQHTRNVSLSDPNLVGWLRKV